MIHPALPLLIAHLYRAGFGFSLRRVVVCPVATVLNVITAMDGAGRHLGVALFVCTDVPVAVYISTVVI